VAFAGCSIKLYVTSTEGGAFAAAAESLPVFLRLLQNLQGKSKDKAALNN